jgi:hypothetical protein
MEGLRQLPIQWMFSIECYEFAFVSKTHPSPITLAKNSTTTNQGDQWLLQCSNWNQRFLGTKGYSTNNQNQFNLNF